MPGIIVREKVASQVHRYLLDRILRGDIAEGARLIETDIAAELSVSRTPVREALVLLQGKDFVTPIDGGGYAVCDFRKELIDILDIRVALESHAVRKAASVIADDEIDVLGRICDEMERLPVDAIAARAEVNRRFHETLVSATRNRRLVKAVNEYQYYFVTAQPLFDAESILHTQQEHRCIVAALRARDGETAARLVAEHIARATDLIRRAGARGAASE